MIHWHIVLGLQGSKPTMLDSFHYFGGLWVLFLVFFGWFGDNPKL